MQDGKSDTGKLAISFALIRPCLTFFPSRPLNEARQEIFGVQKEITTP